MKWIFLFFLPVFSFSQGKLDSITILSGKVNLLVPEALKPMSEQMWSLKYKSSHRPTLVLTDENGEVNLIADMTQQPATEAQLVSFKDYQLQQLKQKRPDLEVLSNGVKTINGRKLTYFKFLTQAVDQKVFNYYFFVIVDKKILLFTFNCIQKLLADWENTADQIVASLRVK